MFRIIIKYIETTRNNVSKNIQNQIFSRNCFDMNREPNLRIYGSDYWLLVNVLHQTCILQVKTNFTEQYKPWYDGKSNSDFIKIAKELSMTKIKRKLKGVREIVR